MSCSRGNHNRTRPQKHQNRTAFKNNLHDTSNKTKLLNGLEITGVCERCREIIEWKIKYKKYKTLTVPGKCVACEQRNIKYAYHVMCFKCATEKNICTKCCKPLEVVEKVMEIKDTENEAKLQLILKNLPERKRRTLLRHIKNQEVEGNMEAILTEISKFKFDNDLSDNDFSESEN